MALRNLYLFGHPRVTWVFSKLRGRQYYFPENFINFENCVHEWNGHIEIFSLPQAIENSRQFLLLRTDISQNTVVGCPCIHDILKLRHHLETETYGRLPWQFGISKLHTFNIQNIQDDRSTRFPCTTNYKNNNICIKRFYIENSPLDGTVQSGQSAIM